jgi:hypothetical protein
VVVDERVIDCAHEYTASGKIGENGKFADTVMHFGEPSTHDVIEAVHTVPVQNDEFPVASFIAVSMPLRQVAVIDAHTELELMTA